MGDETYEDRAYERTKRVYERVGWTDAMCLMAEIARELPRGDPRRVFVNEVLYPRLSKEMDVRIPIIPAEQS